MLPVPDELVGTCQRRVESGRPWGYQRHGQDGASVEVGMGTRPFACELVCAVVYSASGS